MSDDILTFLHESSRLKQMLRSGWIFSGVPIADVESVADHSYLVTLITLLQCLEEQKKGNKVNIEKALIMALIHDLPESISQDIDRRVKKFAPEKYTSFKREMDKNAMKSLLSFLPDNNKTLLLDYFEELHKGESIESKIVNEADRIDTIFQMKNYIQKGIPKENFDEFFINFNQEKNNYQFDLLRELAIKLLKE